MKNDVDNFIPGETSWVPYAKFKAIFSVDLAPLCSLRCDIDIFGARHPNNKFRVVISPQGRVNVYIQLHGAIT